MSKKLCIFYLTNSSRAKFFDKFVQFYSGFKYRDQTELLVLTHTGETDVYEGKLKRAGLEGLAVNFGNANNYLTKVRFAIEHAQRNGIPYIMKHDNDIVMSNHVYDHLFERLETVLNDSANLLLTPTITSGIPTVEYFMEDFCTDEERASLQHHFLRYRFPTSLWGANYDALNAYSVHAASWDSAAFFEGVSRIPHYYKGMHPIRMHFDAGMLLNEYVIQKKDVVLGPVEAPYITLDSSSPYFCNSVFCMRVDTYSTIVNDSSLFRDAFEEVPINLYRNMHHLNIAVARGACAIHFMYNTHPNHMVFEDAFIDRL